MFGHWWAWVIPLLVVAIIAVRGMLGSYRRGIRERFVRYLRVEHPQIDVLQEREDSIVIWPPGGEKTTLFLSRLYDTIADARLESHEQERPFFERFLGVALESQEDAAGPLTLARHGSRLMPRLVNSRQLAQLTAKSPAPHTPLAPGLETVYVLDSPNSVRYLTEKDLDDLGLDAAGLHRRAIENLGPGLPPDAVQRVVAGGNVVTIKTNDTYDAARLLQVPQYLRPGDEIAAVVPDRDTLALMPVPPDGDWSKLRKLARAHTSLPLYDRPLRVTREGFRSV